MGNGTFAIIPKKCEYENDADGLKTYFAIDFGIIFGDFRAIVKKIGAVWDFCGFLFLYRRQPPIFPIGMALFFHVALFFNSRSSATGGKYVITKLGLCVISWEFM